MNEERDKQIQEFVDKVISAERIEHASKLIQSLDTLPEEFHKEAENLFTRMISHLEQ